MKSSILKTLLLSMTLSSFVGSVPQAVAAEPPIQDLAAELTNLKQSVKSAQIRDENFLKPVLFALGATATINVLSQVGHIWLGSAWSQDKVLFSYTYQQVMNRMFIASQAVLIAAIAGYFYQTNKK